MEIIIYPIHLYSCNIQPIKQRLALINFTSNKLAIKIFRKIFAMTVNVIAKTKSSYEDEFNEEKNNSIEYHLFISNAVSFGSVFLLLITFFPLLISFILLQILGFDFLSWFVSWSVIWTLLCLHIIALVKNQNVKWFKEEVNDESTEVPNKWLCRIRDFDLLIALVMGVLLALFMASQEIL